MDRPKNVWWIIPFKKFDMVRVRPDFYMKLPNTKSGNINIHLYNFNNAKNIFVKVT